MWFLLVYYILKNIWKCYDYKQTFWWSKQSCVLHFLCISNANAHICQTSRESTLVIMSTLKNYILKKEKVMQNNSRACQFLKDYLSNWSMKLTASKTVKMAEFAIYLRGEKGYLLIFSFPWAHLSPVFKLIAAHRAKLFFLIYV